MIETEGRIEPESMGVIFHKPEEFEGMRKAGRLAAKVLDFITPHVVPGISTAELDTLCHNFIIDHSAVGSSELQGFSEINLHIS